MTGDDAAARPLEADLIASGALAIYSTAVVAGFARVFAGWHFLDELLPIVLVGHGGGLLLRRRRIPAWVAVPLLVAVIGWLVALLFYGETFAWGMPTTETWDRFTLEMSNVREQFRLAVAPVVYGGGWDVLAALGTAIAVVLADTFAFRAFARAESLVPGGVLFVFVGALGSERLRIALTVLLVAAGVLVVVVLRWYHSGQLPRVRQLALRRTAPAAAAAIVVVAVGAGIVGPRLPGAHAEAVYDTSTDVGGSTSLISPLVDIRSRLTNRSDEELFRVNADLESYWRSTALPEFDGTTWTLPEQQLQTAGTLAPNGTPNRQKVTIAALEGSLVPAAPEPYEWSGPSDLRWAPETATLLTVDDELTTGDTIDILSSVRLLDAAALEQATSTDPGDDIYLALPDDLPPIVEETARAVTAGASSPYDAARMLQAWFQREFQYSLEVQAGHGNDAIETFLRERIGYCEQFAGTYAAMMRTLGIPTRVAVGFTSGTKSGDRVYVVRGRNAHAWPEVWFDDIGWVAFEPTPGRGAPNAEAYTGLPPQQDSTPVQEGLQPDIEAAPIPPASTPVAPGLGLGEPEPTTDGLPVERAEEPSSSVPIVPFLVVGLVAVLIALPWLVRRVRRRHRVATPEVQLAGVWRRSVDRIREAGVEIRPSDTPLEAADVARRQLPIVDRPFSHLASAVTDATYGPEGTSVLERVDAQRSTMIRRCHSWARQIDRAVDESSTLRHRVWRYFTVWH